MTTKKKTNARLTKELLEMAKGMRASGIMLDAAFEKIAARHFEDAGTERSCSST